jgi:hypothetical protein
MTMTDATSAFQALIAHYEASGWEVRTINHTALRATVRARHATPGDGGEDLTIQVLATNAGCRKLWVDSKGEVQETVVPC